MLVIFDYTIISFSYYFCLVPVLETDYQGISSTGVGCDEIAALRILWLLAKRLQTSAAMTYEKVPLQRCLSV